MKYRIGTSAFGKFFTVPCSAVENYMKLADGKFYKALLCALCSNSDIADTEIIAEQCGITPSEAEEALLFWSAQGVIYAEVTSAAAGSGTSAEIKLPEPPRVAAEIENPHKNTASARASVRYTPKDLAQKAKDDPELKTLFDEIQKVFGRPINSTETAALVNIYEYYGYSVASILIMAQFCHDIGKDKIAYIETIARDWFGAGICDYPQIEAEIIRQTEQHGFDSVVKRKLGIEGRLTKRQAEYFAQWREWGFGEDMIDLAGERCRDAKNKTDIRYINGILSRWKNDGLFSIEAVEQSELAYKQSREKKETIEKENSYDLDKWRDIAAAFNPNDLSFEEVEDI